MNARYRDEEKRAAWTEYLVLRCQEGDANALQDLMGHWHSRLYGYALGQLQDPDAAKDATQESLLSISKNIRRLKDPASFPKWAYQIVIRRCADWQRKELRWRARHVTDSDSAIEQAVSSPAESHADTEALRRALGRLEPELSNVVRLYYFDSFSLKEIGELLTLPTGTIKSRLFYARKRLKQAIGEEER
jgi:RNA polymerase sigma-70 factor (ECF subfamily)